MKTDPPLILDSEEIFKIIQREKTLASSYRAIVNSSFGKDICFTNEQKTIISDILKALTPLLKSENVKYWIDWGTFLGAYRDNSIIPWDKDFDLGILSKYKNKLYSIIEKTPNLSIHKESHYYLNLKSEGLDHWLDINLYDKVETSDGTFLESTSEIKPRSYKYFENLDEVELEDLKISMPCPSFQHAPELLSFMYGENWRHPPGNPLIDEKGKLWSNNWGGK